VKGVQNVNNKRRHLLSKPQI